MMRKITLKSVLTMLMMIIGVNAFAQDVSVVGSDTGTGNLIFKSNSKQTKSQFIYLASEINKTGEITKLVFTLNDNVSESDFNKMNTWEVRLGMTSDDEFKSSGSYGPPSVTFLTGTPNFDGDVTLNGKKIEVQLTTPFDYSDTSKNLVVDIVEKNNATNPYSNINLEVFNKCGGWNGCAKKRSAYNTISSYGSDWSSRPSSEDAVPKVTLTFKEETGPYKVTKLEETQINKGTTVGPGTSKVELLAVNVKVGGKDAPLPTLESLTFDLTADSGDVSNLQLWYGTTSDLANATEVNITSPFGMAHTLSGVNQGLQAGSNYFFLTVDVPAGATVGNTIDANFTEVKTTTKTFNTSSTPKITGSTDGAITLAVEPIIVIDNSNFGGTTIYSAGPAEYNSNSPASANETPAPNSWYQMLYTAEDLGYTQTDIQSGKKIKLTSIGFYLDHMYKKCVYNTATKQTIYMKLVDDNDLSNYKHPDGANGFEEVFNGDVTWFRPKSKVNGGPGIMPSVITLDKEFEFTPDKKLVVYYKNQHGGTLKSCGNENNSPNMPFLYAPNKHNKDEKRNVGGKSFADGSRKESTIQYEMIPITYFGWAPATKKIKIKNMPTNAETCEETAYEIKGVTVDPTDATLEWTGGTGTFANGTTLNATYTPAQGETGEVTLTLTATKTGYTEDSKTFKLTVNPKPKFTSTVTTVKVDETITLTTDIAGGTFKSSATSIAVIDANSGVVTGKAVGTATITYTTAEGCEVTQEITVTKKPVADVVIDNMPTTTPTTPAIICQGETYDITGVTVTPTGAKLEWTTSGDGGFSNTDTADTVYTPGANDIGTTITLTLTAKKDGKKDKKVISLKVNAKPVAKIIKK